MLSSTWNYAVRIDKLPVVLGSVAGALIAVWLTPRRVLVPLVVLGTLLFVFVAEGAVGASVVDRYMIGSSVVMLVFCAVAVGGWSMLEPGTALRRLWMVAAALLILYGAASAANTLSLSQPAHHARRSRELPRGACRCTPQPGGGGCS